MKIKSLITTILAAVIVLTGCKKEASVESVKLDHSTLAMTVGATQQLKASTLPADAVAKSITWSSSETAVASVSESGLVTAEGVGEATITVNADGKTATCIVTVSPKGVEEVTLDKSFLEMIRGEEAQLTATVLPEDAENKTVAWSSSDENIATVDDKGLVRAIAIGEAVITAAAGEKSATCAVTVVGIPVEEVILDKTVLELTRGEQGQLTATVSPDDADNKNVTWSSSDEKIATVDANGLVTAVAAGNATVTATAGSKSATCAVTVNPIPVESITLDPLSVTLALGETAQITATVLPADADNKTLVWSSSDEKVATVDANGLVTAVTAGEAVITAAAGEVSATCSVTIKPAVPNLGDIYYSDGTWSTELDASKTPIGVVFWVGDPTKEDPALRREHPECTNGLVVALQEENGDWQTNFSKFNKSVGDWVAANTDYYSNKRMQYEDRQDTLLGYNDTKALELFNAAAENSEWRVNIADRCVAYRTAVPAPEGSSDWFIPSGKELALLGIGEYEGRITKARGTQGRDFVNGVLEKIPEATLLGERSTYWTSVEHSGYRGAYNFSLYQGYFYYSYSKVSPVYITRYVLAF